MELIAMARGLYVGLVVFGAFGVGALVTLVIYTWDHRHEEYDRHGLDKHGRSKWQNQAEGRDDGH